MASSPYLNVSPPASPTGLVRIIQGVLHRSNSIFRFFLFVGMKKHRGTNPARSLFRATRIGTLGTSASFGGQPLTHAPFQIQVRACPRCPNQYREKRWLARGFSIRMTKSRSIPILE